MEENPFIDKTQEPTDDSLKKALSSTYKYYHQLMESTKGFSRQWNYYKQSGWILKVFDKKKALFYLIPHTGQFMAGLTIREKEREIFLNDPEINFLEGMLKEAKKYNEGYAMQFQVTDKASFETCALVISKIMALRK